MAWTDPRKQDAPKASELGMRAGYDGSPKVICPYLAGSAQEREWNQWYIYGADLKKQDEKDGRLG